MARNVPRLCVNCGRKFTAQHGGAMFCSLSCKRMYGNHVSFRCRDCRNASCKVRNNDLVNSPPDCENLKNPNRAD